jgi:hypothetical protein
MKWHLLLTVALTWCALSCGDPVHDDAVNALGPEAPGVDKGPLHRPGQPCLVCHGGSGPASAHFSVAGTVFALKGMTCPLPNANVVITDLNFIVRQPTTNEAGNFWISASDWVPAAPYHVKVMVGMSFSTMTTHVGRDGSCADCHFSPPGPSTTGPVYLGVTPSDLPQGVTCP